MSNEFETRTKIVATLGPSSWDEPVLSDLLRAGVDVCRINCSHSDHEAIRKQVARVRRAQVAIGVPVAILLDLQGPKIRVGRVEGVVELTRGDVLTVVMDPDVVGSGRRVGTTYPEMAGDVQAGDHVLFADGALSGKVCEVRLHLDPPEVDICIEDGGPLGSHKGINLPGVVMSVPSLTDKDRADLAVGLEVGVDYVALSFVRSATDVLALRAELERHGKPRMPIVAKIEKPQAVDALHEILDHVEGVMVARGDLGVEVPIERVPVLQKQIIDAAFRRGRLVITATQMLDSMERNPRPTRAETTDVANAILDGTDAVMLSGETSVGAFPVQAVRMMDNIAREVEASRFFKTTPLDELPPLAGPGGAVWRAACFAVHDADRPFVVFTWSGASAIFASRARPTVPIFALTSDPTVVDRLSLVWGITPILIPHVTSTDDMIAIGERVLLDAGHIDDGQEIVVLAGRSPLRGATNLLKIYAVGRA